MTRNNLPDAPGSVPSTPSPPSSPGASSLLRVTTTESLRVVLSALLGLPTVRAEIVEKHGAEQLQRLDAMVAAPRPEMPEPVIDARYAELVELAESAAERAAITSERLHLQSAGRAEFRAAKERMERLSNGRRT